MVPYLVNKYGAAVRAITLEVEINNASGEYYLPDDSILRQKRVVGLMVGSNPSDSAVSPKGRNLISNAAVASTVINLRAGNDLVLDTVPLNFFIQGLNGPETRVIELVNLNPLKSTLTVGDVSLVTTGESVLLTFLYVD